MFGARMKLLNSQLQVGMLTYETQLVSLYFSNLQSVGTQSAVLASLAFGAINNLYFFDTIPSTGWSYLYRIFYTISLISSLISIANSTISSMIQPEHGLLGNDKESIFYAVESMNKHQMFTLRCGAVAVISLFIGVAVQAAETLNLVLVIIICTLVGVGLWVLYFSTSELKLLLIDDVESHAVGYGTFLSGRTGISGKVFEKEEEPSSIVSTANGSDYEYVIKSVNEDIERLHLKYDIISKDNLS